MGGQVSPGGASGAGGASGGAAGTAGTAGAPGAQAGQAGQAGQTGQGAGPPKVKVRLPQFVRQAAHVDAATTPQVPLAVEIVDDTPSADGATFAVVAAIDGIDGCTAEGAQGKVICTLDASTLAPGPHDVVARVARQGVDVGSASGRLVVRPGSARFTSFDEVGVGLDGQLHHDPTGDRLGLTWVDARSGQHRLYLAWLDGAFERVAGGPDGDLVLSAAGDRPLQARAAFSSTGDALAAVYRTEGAAGGHWFVKMRVLSPEGGELAPVADLTAGEAAFTPLAAAADPGGFSAAWLHISPPAPGGPLPPVELRFARFDRADAAFGPTLKLDHDRDPPPGAKGGTLSLDPLAEVGIACNASVCVVSYTRELWNGLVQLNVAKMHLVVVDLASMTASDPKPVAPNDWDTQNMGVASGHHLVSTPDGGFALVYAANDTKAAVTPKSPCDQASPRNRFVALRLDASGAPIGKPAPMFDHEGQREYPRIAPHPGGFAMLWEDQRSYCGKQGYFRMATGVASGGLDALTTPYLELPGSVGTPPSNPSIAVVDTNVQTSWVDNRVTNSVLDSRPEVFLDTLWQP